MNLQDFIKRKKQIKVAKKATKKARIKFFKDQDSSELWNQIQESELEFSKLIMNKGLDTIKALRYHEPVSEREDFMTLIHKASIILGFDLTECSFFTEYDHIGSNKDEYIIIPTMVSGIFDSNYAYYKQREPERLIADFADVCDYEHRVYDEDEFTGHVVWNKELGAGMIFFSLEDDVNDDQVNIIRTK